VKSISSPSEKILLRDSAIVKIQFSGIRGSPNHLSVHRLRNNPGFHSDQDAREFALAVFAASRLRPALRRQRSCPSRVRDEVFEAVNDPMVSLRVAVVFEAPASDPARSVTPKGGRVLPGRGQEATFFSALRFRIIDG